MADIRVILPDNSERHLKKGANSFDLAGEISAGLQAKVIAARVNGTLCDLQDPLCDGDKVLLLDIKSPEAQDVISHSCEHILALAVIDLFPKAQITMGPKSHAEGFYYDFDIGRPFSEEDLAKIEGRMTELISQDIKFKKRWLSKAEAHELFNKLGQKYKPEILEWIPDDQVTVYENGTFVDLCRGPHLPSSKFIKAFKLLSASGSYWRADASREMLQRVNGVAFASKKELDDFLFRIEEAKKRDHRKLGPKHGLFFVSEKFAQWQDSEESKSEARVLFRLPQSYVENNTAINYINNINKLLAKLKDILPSKCLDIKGMSVLPFAAHDSGEKAFTDLRIFASAGDGGARHLVQEAVQEFSKNCPELGLRYYFDSHAHEEIGPGLVMWLPEGGRLRSLVEDFSRKRHFAAGYDMVYSPHIAKSDLWRISGHLGFYRESMFAPMNVDGNEYLLKPMNCPFHVLMYKFKPRSYRELPLRFAEFGTVYRYEMAGVLHGLMRVRGFTQDDAHLFCRWDQLDEELDKVIDFVLRVLRAFGFNDFEVNISTRPEKFVGEEAAWERAEKSLIAAVKRSQLDYKVDAGGGAFYGPKIDVKLKDCLGRAWQCSTLQLDFNNPARFDLAFINQKGEKEQPVMLHRALFGSIERFIGVLIEHYAAAFPAWLSPEQVRILTVTDRQNDHAHKVKDFLCQQGIRARFHESSEKLGSKIREAQIDKVPLMVIVGDKEASENGGTLRLRSQEDKGFFGLESLAHEIKRECQEPQD
jgi:threonyl-tRNA synthetase